MSEPTKADVRKVVDAVRLYNGSKNYCRPSDETRLHERAYNAINSFTNRFEWSFYVVEELAFAAAERLGSVRPRLGKDI